MNLLLRPIEVPKNGAPYGWIPVPVRVFDDVDDEEIIVLVTAIADR